MSSSVEVKGRPRSSTTPSFMAWDSSRRLRSKPCTSLSWTSNTARDAVAVEPFPARHGKTAPCRHSPKAAFIPCNAPSRYAPFPPPHPTPCGVAPLLSLASPGHFGPGVPRWLMSCSVPPHTSPRQPASLIKEFSCPGEFHSCCSKRTFHVAWAHVPQVLLQGSLDVCFGLQLDQGIPPAPPIPV